MSTICSTLVRIPDVQSNRHEMPVNHTKVSSVAMHYSIESQIHSWQRIYRLKCLSHLLRSFARLICRYMFVCMCLCCVIPNIGNIPQASIQNCQLLLSFTVCMYYAACNTKTTKCPMPCLMLFLLLLFSVQLYFWHQFF